MCLNADFKVQGALVAEVAELAASLEEADVLGGTLCRGGHLAIEGTQCAFGRSGGGGRQWRVGSTTHMEQFCARRPHRLDPRGEAGA